MNVLVDTCIWSLVLRRAKKKPANLRVQEQLTDMIRELRVVIIGAVRQEVLSGIREQAQFNRVRKHLRAFPDLQLEASTYELAASYFNLCRGKGVQGSNTDFLLCAAAEKHNLAVFTLDKDFARYRELLGTSLMSPIGPIPQ